MGGIDRRGLLAFGAAGAGAAGLIGRAQAAQTAGQAMSPARPAQTPQVTEGPYYLEAVHERADITEGLPGEPLDVRFLVLDETGAPLPNARVDIWHCDAAGRYSGFGQTPGAAADPVLAKATFLRGAQRTGADGVVTFHTVYPGWYEGRTTHIHFKVWQGERTVLTCQIFLPDALSEFLYTQAPGYKREQVRDTLNRNDGIALMAGDQTLGSVREAGERYLASLTVVVDRAANPVADRPPRPGEGGFPPGGPGRPGDGKGDHRGPPPGDFAGGPPPKGKDGRPLPPPGGFGPGGPGGPGGPPHRDPLTGEARVAALLPGKPLADAARFPPGPPPARANRG